MLRTAALIFPHQLFKQHPVLAENPDKVWLIEHALFFLDAQYPQRLHQQKLAFHHETCTSYASFLSGDVQVEHVRWRDNRCCLTAICQSMRNAGISRVVVCDVHDFALKKRLQSAASASALVLDWLPTPMFLNSAEQNAQYRATRKRWFMADFYQWQRRRLNVLMEGDSPRGGKWSFDEENRKKLPKAQVPYLPQLPTIQSGSGRESAKEFVLNHFAIHPGSLNNVLYPTTHASAERWLDDFLQQRFENFGPYEDAIVQQENWLYHSVLTPLLNVGLLTPEQVLQRALEAADANATPLASVEGFVRQLIGWREFMRATYDDLGVSMRTSNHWQHTRAMPACFYDGTTGIDPVDDVIKRVLDTGYCHHIERLMVLGGFMFLCEIDPNEIYCWFMELFIDSYDWVMVPNVYAMSQHADGGSITTKPYFSGSNYIRKMSHYKVGDWSITWDALFWRWILNNRQRLAGNYRWAMMCKNADRLDTARVNEVQSRAEGFLAQLA